jgi:hypothetical protein
MLSEGGSVRVPRGLDDMDIIIVIVIAIAIAIAIVIVINMPLPCEHHHLPHSSGSAAGLPWACLSCSQP